MVAEMEDGNTRTDAWWNDTDRKKLGPVRHTSLFTITVSTDNPIWSAPKSGLYKRDGWYSLKFINTSIWSRMWTGRPTDRISIPGRRNTFTCTAERP
jgi:hypothetical protein